METAPPSSIPAPAFVQGTRLLAVASLAGLILLCLAWELWLARTGSGTLALKTVPLVLPLPGLLRNRMYTYRWTSLLVWLYFTEGIVRAASERGTGALLAGIEAALSLLLFSVCAAHVRWRLKRAASPQPRAVEP